MNFAVEPLAKKDFEDALSLWESSEGVVLRSEDRHLHVFERFLARNPRMSCGAWSDDKLVGAVMAGYDGRRGYIYHLAVAADCRHQGIGKALVACVEQELIRQGIWKVHTYVINRNLRAQFFWKKVGWSERDDIAQFSRQLFLP